MPLLTVFVCVFAVVVVALAGSHIVWLFTRNRVKSWF